jgi:hypothetical protein
METRRCPLCWISPECGVIEHLRRDHRRSEVEARALMERYKDGTLGWNAESRKGRQRQSPGPASQRLGCESCGAHCAPQKLSASSSNGADTIFVVKAVQDRASHY